MSNLRRGSELICREINERRECFYGDHTLENGPQCTLHRGKSGCGSFGYDLPLSVDNITLLFVVWGLQMV